MAGMTPREFLMKALPVLSVVAGTLAFCSPALAHCRVTEARRHKAKRHKARRHPAPFPSPKLLHELIGTANGHRPKYKMAAILPSPSKERTHAAKTPAE